MEIIDCGKKDFRPETLSKTSEVFDTFPDSEPGDLTVASFDNEFVSAVGNKTPCSGWLKRKSRILALDSRPGSISTGLADKGRLIATGAGAGLVSMVSAGKGSSMIFDDVVAVIAGLLSTGETIKAVAWVITIGVGSKADSWAVTLDVRSIDAAAVSTFDVSEPTATAETVDCDDDSVEIGLLVSVVPPPMVNVSVTIESATSVPPDSTVTLVDVVMPLLNEYPLPETVIEPKTVVDG